MQDALAATRLMLLRNAEIISLLEDRIFCEEMPPEEANKQPRNALILRHAPNGPPINGFVELQATGFDSFSYGFNPQQAGEVDLALTAALKYARRQTFEDTLLHSYIRTMTGRALREPDTHWSFILSSWVSLASENHVNT